MFQKGLWCSMAEVAWISSGHLCLISVKEKWLCFYWMWLYLSIYLYIYWLVSNKVTGNTWHILHAFKISREKQRHLWMLRLNSIIILLHVITLRDVEVYSRYPRTYCSCGMRTTCRKRQVCSNALLNLCVHEPTCI